MIHQLTNPCWVAACDKCGEGDNSEYGGSFHYPSEADLVQNLDACDWVLVRAGDGSVCAVVCAGCWDEMSVQERETVDPRY